MPRNIGATNLCDKEFVKHILPKIFLSLNLNREIVFQFLFRLIIHNLLIILIKELFPWIVDDSFLPIT